MQNLTVGPPDFLFTRIDGVALGEMRTRTVNSLEGLANYNCEPHCGIDKLVSCNVNLALQGYDQRTS